ncbi:MAG: hypothetical protein MZV64_19980 [Ignavibacteriales bacterium]|nr:hypothetical protein [Ignavibacteriales bacterium]
MPEPVTVTPVVPAAAVSDATGHRHGRLHGGGAGIDVGDRQTRAVQRQAPPARSPRRSPG